MAAPAVEIRRWSREDYERMVEEGFFRPDERVELVDGVIYEMSPQSVRHAVAVRLARQLLGRIFSSGFDFLVQMPMALGEDGEPEPDIAVVPGDPRDHLTSHPRTALLILEVAETSLQHDRERKAGLYAKAGIPEYWILMLGSRQLEVLRDPVAGVYRSRILLNATDQAAPLARPEAVISVADLLP
jgi:Uma2 family endonuclease